MFSPYSTCLRLIAVMLLLNTSIYAQTNQCNNNAGGELTVGAACVTVTMNTNTNNDYWDATGASCWESDLDDKWAWFDATSTSTIITYNSVDDAILTLFTGGCSSSMASIACSDNTAGGNETVTYATTIGTRYRVRIQEYSTNTTMNGTICVYNAPATATNLTCGAMRELCPADGKTYTSPGASTAAEAGNDYDCLGTTDDPVWFYMDITTAGDIYMDIEGTSGDVDFAMWGPYTSIANAQGTCGTLGLPKDCSYDGSSTELADRASVAVGDVYVLMVTNFYGADQVVNITANGSNTCAADCATLPIELTWFDASAKENFNYLQWETTTETDNDYFVIERSIDARHFEAIGTVAGSGTTNAPVEYSFNDNSPLSGQQYYRLKQVDYNGASSFSPTKAVFRAVAADLSIYPNPVSDKVNIGINGKGPFTGRYQLSDVVGNTLKNGEVACDGNCEVAIDLSAYDKGLYLLSVTGENSERLVTKLVKK